MDIQPLLALPKGLEIRASVVSDGVLIVSVLSTQPQPCCPCCGKPATRIHSRYTRQMADVPCGGQRLRLLVRVRKCFCDQSTCPRRIFLERLPAVAEPQARTTTRLAQLVQSIGCATGGRLGARLAARVGIQTSWMTMLRRIMALPTAPCKSVTKLGVDDFAFRRGKRYGTVLIDIETHQVIDVLPDRKTETVAAWMQAHPEIELVSRGKMDIAVAKCKRGSKRFLLGVK